MSKAGLLILASQFAPRLLQIRRGTWLAIALGLIGLLVMLAWAAFALVGWLWGQSKLFADGAPEVARALASQVEQAVPGARERLGDLMPALKPEPPARDVSGSDIGPVARYPGLVRSHWHRDGREIKVRYEGRAEYVAVLDHYVMSFAAKGYAQDVMAATPETEVHDYHKGDERFRFEIARQVQGKVEATIVAVLP